MTTFIERTRRRFAAFGSATPTLAVWTAAILTILTTSASAYAEVWTFPAPESEVVKNVYTVKVDGKPVDVYSARDQEKGSGEYYFASFDFTGSVSIEVSGPFDLGNLQVAPERFGVKIVKKGEKSATLEADKPFQISFEPNKRVKPLLLFGNAPEIDAPNDGDPNVVYFGPGVHKPTNVKLTDGQTLYVAAGAVVYASVRAEGKNITIRGRGVIAGDAWERFKGPGAFILDCANCENLTVRDVTLRGPWSWTFVTSNCAGVSIDGVKICGSNMINDDALDICNSRDVTVKNCFFRTQDDSIAIKGLAKGGAACERIRVEDCVFWTDRANIYRIGYECDAAAMREIYSKNVDVLYYSVDYRDPEEYWANAVIWLQPNVEMKMSDCRFEDFRVRSDGKDIILLEAKPMSCQFGGYENPIPGSISNCSLRNFTVYGERGDFNGAIYIKGASETSDVDGLTLENVEYFGEKIDRSSPCVQIGDFTKNIEIR